MWINQRNISDGNVRPHDMKEAHLSRRWTVAPYRREGKRLLDIFLSLVGMVVFAPVMAVLVLAIRVKLGSPILFRQTRPGLNGQPFIIYKFRTMTNECDSTGSLLPDDKRLTAFGKFLRSSSLDELPELFNVLRGHMSLVGPRPLIMRYLERYTPEQRRRNDVRPGITGWAQIKGRNALSWEERFKLDVWYVDHYSLVLDLKILMITMLKVLKHEGISQEGHVTMSEFMGTQDSLSADSASVGSRR
jgi:lipopolysaccharide/colanic/teichoic acid biosynthesis glycosyltransferase